MQDQIVRAYKTRTPGSERHFQRACKLTPSGTQTNMRFFSPYPLCVKKASGSKIIDVDGNEYIDYCLGSGALFFGHSHPHIINAVKFQLDLGTHYGLNSEPETRLCEKIAEHVPGAECIKLCNTGSEATLHTIRLARAYTKRPKIAKFEGAFHGNHDFVAISVSPAMSTAGPEKAPNSVPESSGIPQSILRDTLILPFNDIESMEELFEKHGESIAGVILEPGGRGFSPKKEFLQKVRSLTKKYGIVLIFDEVKTGFRLALGGAQEYYGVRADLACYGKIIGGGFPIGAFLGEKEIVGLADPKLKGTEKYVLHTGTFNGNPISATAGIAAIELLERKGVYKQVNALTDKIRKGLRDAAHDNKVDAFVTGDGIPWFHIYFTDREIFDYRSASMFTDKEKLRRFHMNLILNGVLPNVAKNSYTSIVHTDEDVQKTIEAIYDSMRIVAKLKTRKE